MEENQVKIPEGWHKSSILELCLLGRGRVISQKEITNNLGTYPVYSSQTQNNGIMGRIGTYDFQGDLVTWTTDGANAGTVFFRSGKFNCTNVCGTLKEKDNNLDLRFLAYKLSTVAKKHVSYIGNPKLMNGTMSKIELTLPLKTVEQRQIATILSKVDEAIAQTEQLIAKYQRIKTGLMQDLLTKGIDENGNIRSEETHAFKDSPLGRIPVEWEVMEISDLGNWKGGKTPSKSNKKYWEGPKYLWYSSKDITSNLLKDSFYKISEIAISETNQEIFPAYKSLIFVFRSGILRHTFPVARSKENFCINQDIKVLVPKSGISSNFLFYFFKYLEPRVLKNFVKAGTTVESIDGKAFFTSFALIPKENEQKRIELILNKLDNKQDYNRTTLHKLQSQKTGLMQDLLSGKVRVNHLIKETESSQ